MGTAHLNAALCPFSKAPCGCNTPHGAKHLVPDLVYSIRHKRALLNGVSSLLRERVYHISMPGTYGKQLNFLKLYFRDRFPLVL